MTKRNWALLVLDWILCSGAVIAALMCLVTAFQLPLTASVLVLTTASSLLFCFLFRLRRGGTIALCVLAGLTLVLVLEFETVSRSAIRLVQELMRHYVKAYTWLQDYYPRVDLGDKPVRLLPALYAVTLFQSWLLSLSLSRWKRVLPGTLGLLLTLMPCFVLLDTPPAVKHLVVLIFCIVVLALTQNVRRRMPEEAPKALLWSAVPAGLLLALLLALYPYEGYQPPLRWNDLAEELDQLGTQLENRSNEAAGLTSTARVVRLDELPSLSNRPNPVMKLTTDDPGTVYLRGQAYDRFDGKSWAVDTARQWPDDCLFPALGAGNGGPSFRYTIECGAVESVVYTPYEITSLPEGSDVVSDAYLNNTAELKTYAFDAVSGFAGDLHGDYTAWVGENCLYLPDETRQILLQWWQSQPTVSAEDPDTAARVVSARVSALARYSRSPERCPSGRDFCDWFLHDAREGYCVHYAAVGAAMLRALDVPARYVTGYVCSTQSGTTEITSLNAHAWVEYYTPYAGWTLLEVTPSEATEFTGRFPTSPDAEETVAPFTRPDRPEPAQTTEATEPTQGSETEPVESTEATQPGSPDSPQPPEPTGFPAWLWIPLAPLLLAGLLVLRRRLARRLRTNKLAAAPPNEQAVLLYRRCRRLSRLTHEAPEPALTAVTKKAVFSQHTLSEEELALLHRGVARQETILFSSGLAKRFYSCYILAVI